MARSSLGIMMRGLRVFAVSVSAFLLASAMAQATEAGSKPAEALSGYELRVAGLSHNIEPGGDEHGLYDIGGSILFPKMATEVAGVSGLWIPRAHLGSTLNLYRKTSFAYAGVTWTIPFADAYQFSFDFGGALNNGELEGGIGHVSMGCHASFRESAALGHALTDRVTVSATIEHFSNARLCPENSGITNIGLMVSYKF